MKWLRQGQTVLERSSGGGEKESGWGGKTVDVDELNATRERREKELKDNSSYLSQTVEKRRWIEVGRGQGKLRTKGLSWTLEDG